MLVCIGFAEFVYLVDCVICHQCYLSACPALVYVCASHCSLSDLLISCCFASFACWSVYALIFCAFSGLYTAWLTYCTMLYALVYISILQLQ